MLKVKMLLILKEQVQEFFFSIYIMDINIFRPKLSKMSEAKLVANTFYPILFFKKILYGSSRIG